MSAVNVIVGRTRLDLFTDGVVLDVFSRVRGDISKVRVYPDMHCAISVRGEVRAFRAIAAILPEVAQSFPELRAAAIDGRLAAALGCIRSVMRARFSLLLPFDLIVVGWDVHGPGGFVFANHNRMRGSEAGAGPEAWTPWDLRGGVMMPHVEVPSAMRDAALPHMQAIMARQRDHLEPSLLLPAGRRMVGGTIEHTIITREKIETTRVGGWVEPIGSPIGGGTTHRQAIRRFVAFLAAVFFGTFALYLAADILRLWLGG